MYGSKEKCGSNSISQDQLPVRQKTRFMFPLLLKWKEINSFLTAFLYTWRILPVAPFFNAPFYEGTRFYYFSATYGISNIYDTSSLTIDTCVLTVTHPLQECVTAVPLIPLFMVGGWTVDFCGVKTHFSMLSKNYKKKKKNTK